MNHLPGGNQMQLNCMTKFNGNMIIGTSFPNQLIEINLASLALQQPDIKGSNPGPLNR